MWFSVLYMHLQSNFVFCMSQVGQNSHDVWYYTSSTMKRGLHFVSGALLSVFWIYQFISKTPIDLCHRIDQVYHVANPMDG